MNNFKFLSIFLVVAGICGIATPAQAESRQIIMDGVININTASMLELMQLPGIGYQKAEDIVNYRSRREFKKASELMKIKGVGRKMYDRLADHVTVSGPTQMAIIRKSK